MHQNVNYGGVEPVGEAPVGEAPIGLYTKLRKTRTFEMDVMQKVLIGKLSNLHMYLYQYHSISAIWATTNKTILFYSGCVNMQKYDHISWIGPQIRWGCYIIPFK